VRGLLTDAASNQASSTMRSMGITSGPFFSGCRSHRSTATGRPRALAAADGEVFAAQRGRLRPFLTTAAHELIDAFAGRGHAQFVAEFADVFPSLGLSELIGVPTADLIASGVRPTPSTSASARSRWPRITEIDGALRTCWTTPASWRPSATPTRATIW
jgi:hypothetical protein